MRRKNKLLFVGVGILVLLGGLGATTMSATTEFVTPTTLSLGDCVTFRLTNRSDEEQLTGIEEKYDIHRRTADGWQSVLFTKWRAYEDPGISQRRGEGFVWRRRLSRGGLSVEGDKHVACEPLGTGTYRFVYWGVGDGFDALGVKFEVTE